MRVHVLLPEGATWRPLALVAVVGHGPVDGALPHAARYDRQVDLELQAVDETLDELLRAVGERAIELGGVAFDGRSLDLLVEPPSEAERERDPDDPGPIWEHLPGDWSPPPARGDVVDAERAIAQIEEGIADVGAPDPPQSWVETRIGIRMVLDWLRGRR